MPHTLWIRNGLLISSTASVPGDLIISNGIIEAIGQELEEPQVSYTEIDAEGKWILPGGIDPHVHLQLPTPAGNSCDDFASGSRAAIQGGTTSLIDFITPKRGQALEDAIQLRLQEASASLCDYDLHLGISEWNPQIANALKTCVLKYRIRSVKAYLAYRKTIGINTDDLRQLMMACKELDVVVCVHCEDGEKIEMLQQSMLQKGVTGPVGHLLSRPPETEAKAVETVVKLCQETLCTTYLVHISAADSLPHIRRAKDLDLPLYAETCPQYLLLDKSGYSKELPEALGYIISPPLRTKDDQDALWTALTDGTIDSIGTDHCPFNLKGQKSIGADDFTKIPNGTGGIESRLLLLYTYGVVEKRISREQWVSLISEMPSRIFGLWPRKGNLMPGSDADLVIWDPLPESIIHAEALIQHCDHTLYEGFHLHGEVSTVIQNGLLVYQHKSGIIANPSGHCLFRI